MQLLNEYMVSGIAESGIRQFGGDQCFAEMPPLYHYAISLFFGSVALGAGWLWRNQLSRFPQQKLRPNLVQKICFWAGSASLLLTLYFKVVTKRGLFILNPCHIALTMLLVLLKTEDNTSVAMKRLKVAFNAWLFCPFCALVLPHLEEISIYEFLLYYIEHFIILPIGPLVLLRRYGNHWPSLKVHAASYGTIISYQTLLLVPISRWFKVNLNFALCHSPEQPLFPIIGYHYLVGQFFNLCIVSFLVHLATSSYVWVFQRATEWFSGKSSKKE